MVLWALVLIGMITYGLTKSHKEKHLFNTENDLSEKHTVSLTKINLNLPEDFDCLFGEDSPGIVTFRHNSHVEMQDEPDCTTCHSGMFEILEDGTLNINSVTMDAMYEGYSCGKYHNGEEAFSAEEDCDFCHIA